MSLTNCSILAAAATHSVVLNIAAALRDFCAAYVRRIVEGAVTVIVQIAPAAQPIVLNVAATLRDFLMGTGGRGSRRPLQNEFWIRHRIRARHSEGRFHHAVAHEFHQMPARAQGWQRTVKLVGVQMNHGGHRYAVHAHHVVACETLADHMRLHRRARREDGGFNGEDFRLRQHQSRVEVQIKMQALMRAEIFVAAKIAGGRDEINGPPRACFQIRADLHAVGRIGDGVPFKFKRLKAFKVRAGMTEGQNCRCRISAQVAAERQGQPQQRAEERQ